MDNDGLTTVLRLVLGITLTTAGIGKTQNLRAFAQGVMAYQILPTSLARWYGRLLPIVEIGTGAFLLLVQYQGTFSDRAKYGKTGC